MDSETVEVMNAERSRESETFVRLASINRALTTSLNFEEVLDLIAGNAAELIRAESCLVLLSGSDELLRVRASRGAPKEALEFYAPMDESIVQRLRELLRCETSGALTSVPVVINHSVNGLLAVVRKEQLCASEYWLLSALADQAAMALRSARLHEMEIEQWRWESSRLASVSRELSALLNLNEVMTIVCRAARDLVSADGASFVVRENDEVHYLETDAIAPLWKGQRFKINQCISGWSMLNQSPEVIEDVYADERIPLEPYRPTFVKSLAMVPMRTDNPLGAIGVYWAEPHRATEREVELLTTLADSAAIALVNAQLYEELSRSNRLKDEFLATLSHELRNPLNVILGYSDLLRRPEERPASEIAHAANIMHRNALAQSQLISDLLDLSRLHIGKLELERKPIALRPIIADAVEAVRFDAEAKQINLEVELTSEPLNVTADALRVRQIAWNLLNNAVKFTPEHGSVKTTLHREGRYSRLVVEDTGEGIEPRFLPFVFDMFRQGDASSVRRHGGMGIGLALVRKLVELHHGRIEAESEGVGRGARFTLWLPLDDAEKEAAQLSTPTNAGLQLSNVRVLVVDDSQDTTEVLRLLLESEGASTETASSSKDALRIARQEDFDLILCDISMPGMDGYDLLRELRAHPRTANVPAIALSGLGQDEDIERARQAGFFAHLTKPAALVDLIKSARAALDRGQD